MKIGMVLAGGGAKGAYQIGVWKALKELEIDKYINIISGTSIGALNAVLFMQNDLELAENMWRNITKEKILPINDKDLTKKGILLALGLKNIAFIKKHMPKVIVGGNISRDGLIEVMEEINFDLIKSSNKNCYVACTEVSTLMPKYFYINNREKEDIKKILLATSALPMIYECEEIEYTQYLDGGIVDNLPIQPVYGEGCDLIILVHLSKENMVNKSAFPNTSIINIVPSVIEEGVLGGTLDFTVEGAQKRIKLGYEDTINIFNPIMNLTRFIEDKSIVRKINVDSDVLEKNNNPNKINKIIGNVKNILGMYEKNNNSDV
ncbi:MULTISPECIES: patatin-like phospholipase family protein [Clostridium]|uniref:Patatin-like phospholipase family protein n=1 Tax=Clostridium senegalense TaxID=1465809 RepID=A0A6M0H5H9_9CLOT|nr:MULTISPECIES: patatin-like phospholipase family protein [Clostridium]NEU05980.1 patatin-like phospholipase family protein [Clostridium senegalense]